MADGQEVFLRARNRKFTAFSEDEESQWKGPFYFIQGADPQFGLMKAWSVGDCDNGGDEWGQEIRLTEEAVQALNKLNPKPKFFVLCGDLNHAMPGEKWQKEQEQDLKNVLKKLDQAIPMVFVSGNHDIGNTPTPETVAGYCKSWGDDYYSYWVGGVLFLVLNSQFFFDSSKCPELKEAHDKWLSGQLAIAEQKKCKHAIVFQHIPLFLKNAHEDHDYFNIEGSVRQALLERFHKADELSQRQAEELQVQTELRSSRPAGGGRTFRCVLQEKIQRFCTCREEQLNIVKLLVSFRAVR
ncbi:serine/threonine-protein phosphatase CPPED1 isoform X2 [Rhinatrema bivittatum]|uniref:serine/threonine-protein phosphatase CPPED1 isoform X2 n=1 Tax=Rhinatrema bivittatum TaxID=194408 RepID=UPI00112B129B|nr:serine/threonine-protein phosphatase CPPED1 isoform X2 [Rhinatrema bivittatum]